MSDNFSCPYCGKKQNFKRLVTLSNASRWHCPHCNTLLKARQMSPYSTVVGFLSTAVPSYYLLFVKHVSFGVGMGVGALCGVVCYLLFLLYFYFTVKLEETNF